MIFHPHPTGMLLAFVVLGAISSSIYWMLHPPSSRAEKAAKEAHATLAQLVGSIVVVFSEEIRSEHMMVLAAKLARRERAELLAIYVIEVPRILAETASTPIEDRAGYDVLATAEAIAQRHGVHLLTEIVHTRQISQGVIDIAKREEAHLIVIGSYREGKYTGAPLGRAIEQIATHAKCDVLIGVQGQHGTLLTSPSTNGTAAAAR